jgi:hypothetical protein
MEVTTLRGDALNQHAKKVFKGLMRAYVVIISMATLFYGALFLFDFVLLLFLVKNCRFQAKFLSLLAWVYLPSGHSLLSISSS